MTDKDYKSLYKGMRIGEYTINTVELFTHLAVYLQFEAFKYGDGMRCLAAEKWITKKSNPVKFYYETYDDGVDISENTDPNAGITYEPVDITELPDDVVSKVTEIIESVEKDDSTVYSHGEDIRLDDKAQ